MQALELGDKVTADKIESLIRNFHLDSPTPISVYVPSAQENYIPDASSPSSFGSDSPMMTRSSKLGGSRRRASRAPHGSLLDAQTTIDSDVDDHQKNRLHFSADHPCSFDCEINVVGEEELRKYKSRFEIPDSVILMLPGNRAVWNPPENAVTIYGAMLSCRVTLPLQPFIARFLTEAQIAPTQLAPNSYRILMCLCLIWKLKGFGPPTPREIRHFYTLRQAGNSGTYFLLSSAVENWIAEGVANPGQVEVSSDEKKKGFIWGFPTSNKRWKNNWFFVGSEWGRDVPASGCHNLPMKKVPRHFTSLEAWSKTIPVLLDGEISYLATAAILPLDERGRPFLLDEEKMIAQRIFRRLPARLPRLCDFDTVYNMQARVVKNSEVASRRHAAGLAKEGIFDPDGGDPSNGEDTGDILGGDAKTGQPPARQEVAEVTASAPSHKGKEKVGVSRASDDIPTFDANVPETPPDPASDLNPRAGRGKHPTESTPDHTIRPPKRASRVVQYVVSSDDKAVPPPEGVNELNVSAPTPPRAASPPRVASPPAAVGEPNVSSTGVAREAPPVGSTEADEGTVSLSDFSATEICSYLINHDVCIGEGWEHIKGKPYKRKMEFFFNCHSLLPKKNCLLEEEIRLLKEQLSTSQESLAARLEAKRLAEEAKEKAEREALDLRNQLSSRDIIFDDLKAVLEVEAVDRFKRSPAYDALLLRKFERGMRQLKKFFAMKNHSNEKALRRFDKSLQLHMASGVGSIKEQRKRWKAHCRYTRTEPHPMHLEIPSKRAFNTYYSDQKGSFSGSSAEPDLGLITSRDYGPFMSDGDEEVV
ncbi:hypothetical protein LWI29_009920 [Acer saccharum]|uniref:Uncharacterized protein n=1 Tax=Acer saccharum TaxID=4024 RepID=A0AA39RHC5_ACESA|nr:hypothetical protein LWI29_009920 [Acer saccharum]